MARRSRHGRSRRRDPVDQLGDDLLAHAAVADLHLRRLAQVRLEPIEGGQPPLVPARVATRPEQAVEGRLGDAGLAEGRQHCRDEAQEAVARSDHEDAIGGDPMVVVDEPRGAMQADDRLAGAWSAAQHEPSRRVEPHQVVLFGLQRGHRGAHRLAAAARELGHQRRRTRHLTRGEVLDEQVVDVTHIAHPAGQAAGIVESRLVEALGERGAPVDHELLASRVDPVQPDAPGVVVVDAPEHDEIVLQLVDGTPNDAGDVLLGQGVGPFGRQAGQLVELGLDGVAGARRARPAHRRGPLPQVPEERSFGCSVLDRRRGDDRAPGRAGHASGRSPLTRPDFAAVATDRGGRLDSPPRCEDNLTTS